jgi:curved DNA-binding protein
MLRVPGMGGKGMQGGRAGDLYLDIQIQTHPLFRISGQDLYIDLPLAPWEAVLGTSVELPTPAGAVALKVPAGTRAGQQLRLAGRGQSSTNGSAHSLVSFQNHRTSIHEPTLSLEPQHEHRHCRGTAPG